MAKPRRACPEPAEGSVKTRLTATAAPGFAAQQSALLLIRPNDVVFADDSAERNVVPGIVRQATYLGEKIDYRVEVSEGLELRVEADATRRHAVGERVHLPAERLRLIAEE